MAPQTDYVVVDPDGPCPCRSGKITVDCCMAADRSFKVKFSPPRPSGRLYGFRSCKLLHARHAQLLHEYCGRLLFFECRARPVGRERRGRKVPMGWTGREAAVRMENLPADILCSRHHDALATLDAVAIQAFRNILDAVAYVTMKSLATKKTLTAASGGPRALDAEAAVGAG